MSVIIADGHVIPSHRRFIIIVNCFCNIFFFRFGFFVGFSIVNKEPHNIEHTAEPGYDEDYMQRFEVDIHCFNVGSMWWNVEVM